MTIGGAADAPAGQGVAHGGCPGAAVCATIDARLAPDAQAGHAEGLGRIRTVGIAATGAGAVWDIQIRSRAVSNVSAGLNARRYGIRRHGRIDGCRPVGWQGPIRDRGDLVGVRRVGPRGLARVRPTDRRIGGRIGCRISAGQPVDRPDGRIRDNADRAHDIANTSACAVCGGFAMVRSRLGAAEQRAARKKKNSH